VRTALVLAGWAVRRTLSRPWFWCLLVAALLAAWPLERRLAELGIASASRDPASRIGAWFAMSGLAGSLAGLASLSSGESPAARLTATRRLLGEGLGLLAVCLSLQAPMVLAVEGSPEFLTTPGSVWGLALLDLHLAAIALVALHLPIGRLPALLAFAVAAWILPALVHSAPVGPLLDAARHLEGARRAPHTLPGLVAEIAPVVALLLAARLLASRSTSRA